MKELYQPTNKEFQPSPEEEKKERNKSELGEGFNIEFYVTDHSADKLDMDNPEKLKELYSDIKQDGIASIRYDWHWRNIEAKQNEYSEEDLARY